MTPPDLVPGELRDTWSGIVDAPRSPDPFDPSTCAHLPSTVQRWLLHSIDPDTPLRRRLALTMHGEIKVGRWRTFTAQQVIGPDGFIWAARAGRFPLRISGFDRYTAGTGQMRWKLWGLVPVMAATGADVTRSAAGRFAGETMLIPGAALADHVSWHDSTDTTRATATVRVGDLSHEVAISVDGHGSLRSVSFPRWGDPDHGKFSLIPFGVEMDDEVYFSGCRVPTSLRAGWWYGTSRWQEGEFFRATLDEVRFS